MKNKTKKEIKNPPKERVLTAYGKNVRIHNYWIEKRKKDSKSVA